MLVRRYQSVSQSVRKFCEIGNFKIRINFVEGFMVDLKTFLGLAMPNQSCLDVTKQILSWFWGDILEQEIPNLYDPYIIPSYKIPLKVMIANV